MDKVFTLPTLLGAGIYDGTVIYKNIAETRDRRTAIFEIELPVSDGGISFIDGKANPVTANHLICARPGQMRRTRLPFKCFYVHLLVSEGLLFDTLSNVQNYIFISDIKKYRKMFKNIIDAYSNPTDESKIYMQSKLLQLIYYIAADGGDDGYNPIKENSSIKKSLEYMDRHSMENITLEDIARHVSLSRTYFHSLFRKAMGITPQQYMLNKKLGTAKNQLLLGEKTISEIAYETGFSSQSYFNYVFKKEVGMTPCAYRKAVYKKYPR